MPCSVQYLAFRGYCAPYASIKCAAIPRRNSPESLELTSARALRVSRRAVCTPSRWITDKARRGISQFNPRGWVFFSRLSGFEFVASRAPPSTIVRFVRRLTLRVPREIHSPDSPVRNSFRSPEPAKQERPMNRTLRTTHVCPEQRVNIVTEATDVVSITVDDRPAFDRVSLTSGIRFPQVRRTLRLRARCSRQ